MAKQRLAKQKFHILARNSRGGLTRGARQAARELGIAKLDFKTAKTARTPRKAREVIVDLQKVLPRSVSFAEEGPFLILKTPLDLGGSLAICKCQCSLTSSCGGGGGGS